MTKALPKVSCIILAGGEGKRVDGKDKGLIKLDNTPYIEHVINKIKNQTDEIIISANRNIDTYKTYCDTVISDTEDSYQGPLSGISSCLSHCKQEWVLIVPCDMPYLPKDLTKKLYSKINTESIAIASVNDRHQLVMLINKNLLPSLKLAISNKQLKLIKWVESQNYCRVSFNDQSDLFINLNKQIV